jgi:hypothetical protein
MVVTTVEVTTHHQNAMINLWINQKKEKLITSKEDTEEEDIVEIITDETLLVGKIADKGITTMSPNQK